MAKKILVADDSDAIRKAIAVMLQQEGYEVTEAFDGVEGLEKAKNDTFDLVVTDIDMPNLNGIGLVREIRGLAEYKSTPILMLGTEAEVSKINQGKESGKTSWLVKPFDKAKLLEAVGQILK
ncbi:response regulator [Streptomyces xanthochromogenes]|uniref:response regulator n=1 Tax=Streptomyces xanthochromogenes TaxID=67384 RepID=UPI0034169B68